VRAGVKGPRTTGNLRNVRTVLPALPAVNRKQSRRPIDFTVELARPERNGTKRNGRERKGTEGNGRERKGTNCRECAGGIFQALRIGFKRDAIRYSRELLVARPLSSTLFRQIEAFTARERLITLAERPDRLGVIVRPTRAVPISNCDQSLARLAETLADSTAARNAAL